MAWAWAAANLIRTAFGVVFQISDVYILSDFLESINCVCVSKRGQGAGCAFVHVRLVCLCVCACVCK